MWIQATGQVAARHAVELATGVTSPAAPARPRWDRCAIMSPHIRCRLDPANITFDLLPTLDEETRNRMRHDKRARHAEVCRRALEKLDKYRSVYA